MPTPWSIPQLAIPHGRYSTEELRGFWEFVGGDPAQDASWEFHLGEKGPYFVANRRIVESKARMGQQVIEGLTYSRAALDEEALARVISWGYPATPEAYAAWEESVGPYVAAYYSGETPEAIIGGSVSDPLYWQYTKTYLLPGMPTPAEIARPIIKSYP